MKKISGIRLEKFLSSLEETINDLEENPSKFYPNFSVYNVDTEYGIVTITIPDEIKKGVFL